MEIYLTVRPAALPAALAPTSGVRVLRQADAPLRPQAHQVPSQAELVQAPESAGNKGINGFTGRGIPSSVKRMDVRGVPPRGRPV